MAGFLTLFGPERHWVGNTWTGTPEKQAAWPTPSPRESTAKGTLVLGRHCYKGGTRKPKTGW